MPKPEFVVIAGPSGAGKTALLEEFKKHHFEQCVTVTTRDKRAGEIDGIHYHFRTVEEFEEMLAGGAFVEFNKYAKEGGFDYYGTPKKGVNALLQEGRSVIASVEINGAKAIKEAVKTLLPCAPKFLYIAAESEEVLEKRLAARGMSPERIKVRLAKDPNIPENELPFKFDAYIVNKEGQFPLTVKAALETVSNG